MAGFGSSPFGSTPFGALSGEAPADLADGFAVTAASARAILLESDAAAAALGTVAAASAHWHALFESIALGEVAAGDVLANLVANLNATGSVHLNTLLAADASDEAVFYDSVMAAWRMLLAENITGADTATANVRKLVAIIDLLAATGQAQGSLAAFAACTSALTLESLQSLGYAPNAVDSVVLAETASALARLLGPLVDNMLATDSAAPTLRVSVVSADTVEIDDDPATTLRFNADLAESVLLYATLRLGGTDYVGWVMNTTLKAASEHRNVAFDSFATFKGKDYAAGPGGLVQFTGDEEGGGGPIAAAIKTALYDFGTSKFKRVPEAFIGATDAGQLVLKTLTRDPKSGVLTEDWYRVERMPLEGPGTGRAKPGKGLKSTYWQFVLVNVNGADFALNKLELRPLYLDRRT